MSFKSRFENPSKPADTIQPTKPEPLPAGTQRELEDISRRKMAALSAISDQRVDHRSDQIEIKDQPDRDQLSIAPAATQANPVAEGWRAATQANPATQATIATPTSLDSMATAATQAPAATQANLAIPSIAQNINRVAVLATLEPSAGFTKIPNWILDSLPAVVDLQEQMVYIHLYRLSHGFGKDRCLISLNKISERTGISKRTVQDVIGRLQNKGLVEKLGNSLGKNGPQGVIFRIATLATQADVATQASNASQAIPASQAGKTTQASLATQAADATNKDLKRNLKKYYINLISKFRQINTGRQYMPSELADDVKRQCLREGKHFDFELFNEVLAERSR